MATMLMPNEPVSPMLRPGQLLNHLFRDSFMTPFERLNETTSTMPVDVYEIEDAFVVKASMPGLTADDLSINVEQRVVTIQGEAKAEEQQGLHSLHQERRIGRFMRTFTLPSPVDAAKVQAVLENGVLTLTLPKSEAFKPRRIQVRS